MLPDIRFVNTKADSGKRYDTNCAKCALAVDLFLAEGVQVQAGPGGDFNLHYVDRHYISDNSRGVLNLDWRLLPTNRAAQAEELIVQEMTDAGPGSRGMVVIGNNESAHIFNVVNLNGTVLFLDGQSNTVRVGRFDGRFGGAPFSATDHEFDFVRTDVASGLPSPVDFGMLMNKGNL